MRNYNRSQRGARRDAGHNVAGVGELRAVAERLLETGAQYLEQGRQWLHEATSKERAHAGEEHAGHHHVDESGFGSSRAGSHEDAGGGGTAWSGSARGGSAYGAYSPDESSFSETGGNAGWRAHSGHDYDDHRTREFDARAEELARNRGRGHHRHGHGHRHGGGYEEDPFVPGSYGFGGEGRRQAGPSDFSGQGRSGRHAAEDASGRWEQAYRAQGQGSQRGRGPRGYTRSDARILEDVNERLCDDPIVDASDIEVRCEQGCIVLEGRVPTRWMKHRAEDIADAISGVKDVDNRIRVAAEEPAPTGDFDTGGSGSRWQSPDTASASTSRTGSSAGSGTGSSSGSGASAASGSGSTSGPGSGSGQGSASGTTPGAGSASGSGATSGASASSGAASGASSTSGAPPSGTGAASGASSTSGTSPSSGTGAGSGGASGTGPQGSGQAGDATRNPPQPH